jgi:hypothetical protein
MAQIASTHISIRRFCRWTIAVAALASLLALVPGAGASQDLRSPDARAVGAVWSAQDVRSPDAREYGQFDSSIQQAGPSDGGFAWGFLALAVLVPLTITGSVLLVMRHRHRPLPLGEA